MMDIYKELVNDWTHFIDTHSYQLQDMNQQLIYDDNFDECQMEKCGVFKRYYNHKRIHAINNKTEDTDKAKSSGMGKRVFYCELFDNIRHYLFHLYQLGMRTKTHIIIIIIRNRRLNTIKNN